MFSSIYSQSWYKGASVRGSNPIVLNTHSTYPLFPEELQPICGHPLITEFKKFGKEYMLTQMCYKYLQEICITETEVVNPICLNIAYGKVPVSLSEEIKADAFSIIVDEAFHSYVARSFMLQVQKHSGIVALDLPRENEVTKAIKKINAMIPSNMQADFELVATCISENVFTEEIIDVSRMKNVNESFHQLMLDHARDEGRHAGYFAKVMEAYWNQAEEYKKKFFVKVIPQFIEYCLDGIHDRSFLIRLLQEYGLDESKINSLLAVNHNEVTLANKQARIDNIVRFLKRSTVLNYTPLAERFSEMVKVI